jgi:acyl-CoA reductase-like NAD-dependent aldehyde dehydrogenase
MVNFMGSTNVGRIIGVRAAQHLKPAVLEFGGKNRCSSWRMPTRTSRSTPPSSGRS